MKNIILLNKYLNKRIDDYMNLPIGKVKVSTPYYINNVEEYFLRLMKQAGVAKSKIEKVHEFYKQMAVPYGWHRGKGEPEDIVNDIIELAKVYKFSLNNSDSESIVELMKFYGLGVDCSGFVYNCLVFSFKKIGLEKEFISSLNWKDPKNIGVTKAGAFVFSGDSSSIINISDIQPLDLMLIKNTDDKYVHIGIFCKRGKHIYLAQSVITSSPSGINLSINQKSVVCYFDYNAQTMESLDDLYKKGYLEIRRLKILNT